MSTGCARSGDGDDRRRAAPVGGEEASEAVRVGGRRHRRNAQVGTQGGGHVERQGEAEVGGQVAFVDLVEDDRSHPRELRIGLQPARQHAFGEHFDAGRRPDRPIVAGLVADQLADALTGELGHPPRGGARRQTPGLEDHDRAVVAPWRLEQGQRHERGLAGPRRRRDHHPATLVEGGGDVSKRCGDRERGQADDGAQSAVAVIGRPRFRCERVSASERAARCGLRGRGTQ